MSTVWASISVSYALVVGSNRDGTKPPVRRACIGSTHSPWRYDAGTHYAFQWANPQRPAISHCAPPLNLLDALRALQASKLLNDGLGEYVPAYLKLKHQEWNDYSRYLTDWERDTTHDC